MNLFGRDLKPDVVGEDVRQLHDELAQFGMVTPGSERQNAEILVGEMEQSWKLAPVLLQAMASNKGEASCWIDEVSKVKSGF